MTDAEVIGHISLIKLLIYINHEKKGAIVIIVIETLCIIVRKQLAMSYDVMFNIINYS